MFADGEPFRKLSDRPSIRLYIDNSGWIVLKYLGGASLCPAIASYYLSIIKVSFVVVPRKLHSMFWCKHHRMKFSCKLHRMNFSCKLHSTKAAAA